ncbi:CHASE4 domain-containing protein [Chloroflexota bacterium]
MTLRTKALGIIGVALLCMAGFAYITSRFTFMRGLEEIDKRDTSKHVEQALGAFSYLVSDLEIDTANWAARDDTYAFIEDSNSAYIQSNLGDESFVTLKLNLVLFIHSSGHIVFGKAFDLENEEEIPIPPDLFKHLSANSLLLSQATMQNFTSGIISLKQGPILIASQPILTGKNEGPIRGTLIFARYLDSEIANELGQVLLFPITLHSTNEEVSPELMEALASLLQDTPIFVKSLDTKRINGYALIKDIYEKPSFILRVETPRDAYQLGQVTISYYILSILGMGVLAGAITMLLIQTQVLSRFTRLIRGIDHISTSGDTTSRISLGGKDELSLVAGTINGMLGSLHEAEGEIRESEERYRDLFENATDLIQSVDADSRILFVNEAWQKTLGYSGEDISNLSLWDIIHPDYISQCREIFQKVLSGEPADNIETIFITKSGESITVEGNASCRFKEGEILSTRGIFHNITERKLAEEQLQQLYKHERDIRQKLEEEIRKRTEFTRALVHELKTPITPVLAATELLLEEIKDARPLRLVQSIDRSAANLNRRIDELVDLIRGETDMLPVNLMPVDVTSLLQDIGQEMESVASRDGYSLTVELPSSNIVLPADRDRLRQIIQNLLNNALKFTPTEGEITLRAREKGANLVVEVQDTGLGISRADQKRLFDPYYRRVEDRERLSGLGLGLALAKKLVELHGGQVWVKSKKGQGSTFGFSLPLK